MSGPDGSRAQIGSYVNGKLDGRVTRWHETGLKKNDASYLSGDLDGPWRAWYPYGSPASRGGYRYGLREGRWIFHDKHGAIDERKSGVYEADERVRD